MNVKKLQDCRERLLYHIERNVPEDEDFKAAHEVLRWYLDFLLVSHGDEQILTQATGTVYSHLFSSEGNALRAIKYLKEGKKG